MNLEKHIKDLINKDGAMTIAQYMSLALTHEKYGYYRKNKAIGKEGDFITAPEISQIFGELIGVWMATCWKGTGSPEATLVELGPGRGTLMSDILRSTNKVGGFHDKIEVHLVEINEQLIEAQKESLSDYDVRWHTDLSDLPEKPMFLIANEFFDALPIHQFIKTKDGWRERLVYLNEDNNLAYKTSSEETLNCKMIPKRLNDLDEGYMYEASPQSIKIIKDIAQHIAKYNGAALIIDYGYYNNSFSDSLQAVKNHQFYDPLKTPGEVDITAHVNFTRLGKEAEKIGARAQGNVTQGDFLANMGIEIRAHMLAKHADEKMLKELESQINRLISPQEMGALFKCLALTNNNSAPAFGFLR